MKFQGQKAEEYIQKYSSPVDDLLSEVEAFTQRHHADHIHMLSGPVQGKILEMISQIIRPRRILEIGTFTGYSALCLAKGLAPDGQLHTIELRDADADIAENFFAKSLQGNRIILHRGNALHIIPSLNENWDLIFIDADKVNYIQYYELTLPALKKDGLILADNVLFHGEVLEDPIKGKNAKAIQAFNEHVANDGRVNNVILSVRDGLMMIQKK